MSTATVPLLLLLLFCECSRGESTQDRPAVHSVVKQVVPTLVLQRHRDAVDQVLLLSDGSLVTVRRTGSRLLDTCRLNPSPTEIEKLRRLAGELARVPAGKSDAQEMDGAEFTVSTAPAKPSSTAAKRAVPTSGGKNNGKKNRDHVEVTVLTRHEDLLPAPLRRSLHAVFDAKRPSAKKKIGAFVRVREFVRAMGLNAKEAEDVAGFLAAKKLESTPAPPYLESIGALRWRGVLIPVPVDKLPKPKDDKPAIVESKDRYFVVDMWRFERK